MTRWGVRRGRCGALIVVVSAAAFTTGCASAGGPDGIGLDRPARSEAADPQAATKPRRIDARLEALERTVAEQADMIAQQQQTIAWLKLRRTTDRSDNPAAAETSTSGRPQPLVLAQGDDPVAPIPPTGQPIAPGPTPDASEPVPPARGDDDGPSPAAPEDSLTSDRPEAERPTDQLLVDRGGVLLPAGTLQVEPSFEYAHSSSDRVAISGFSIFDAIVIGNIRVDDLERDILTASLTARYGITDRLQAELRVPYVYRADEEILGVGTNDQRARSVSGSDIGDISGSLSYQALSQDAWIPATILRASATAPTGRDPFGIPRETIGPGGETRLTEVPTGSGFWGVGPEVTFVWRADPAVFFAGGGYTFNLPETFDDFGEVDPGDTIEWFAGTNFALSELVSLNLAFVNQLTGETEQNGIRSEGTSVNDARFQVGTSIGLSPSTSLLTSAGIGLTDESPDFTFTISVPITFDLFGE